MLKKDLEKKVRMLEDQVERNALASGKKELESQLRELTEKYNRACRYLREARKNIKLVNLILKDEDNDGY